MVDISRHETTWLGGWQSEVFFEFSPHNTARYMSDNKPEVRRKQNPKWLRMRVLGLENIHTHRFADIEQPRSQFFRTVNSDSFVWQHSGQECLARAGHMSFNRNSGHMAILCDRNSGQIAILCGSTGLNWSRYHLFSPANTLAVSISRLADPWSAYTVMDSAPPPSFMCVRVFIVIAIWSIDQRFKISLTTHRLLCIRKHRTLPYASPRLTRGPWERRQRLRPITSD